MKKRAALARAIVMDPDILFCDEPSADSILKQQQALMSYYSISKSN
jgi:ABC-type transporter Mla maintaining outer membrane lipid asymmetry ATPase subunit MlaF